MAVAKNKSRRYRGRSWPTISKAQLSTGIRHGFRSGLERDNALRLDKAGVVVRFEDIKIPYVVPQQTRKYTPDFILPNGIIIETKGKLEPKDRGKHLFIKEQWPDLDIRFVFSRPGDKIYKKSPTTYKMWCEKYGFKWASRVIPEHWIAEEGPKRSPDDVLNPPKKKSKGKHNGT